MNVKHNLVNLLYIMRGMLETCFERNEEERFRDAAEKFAYTDKVLKRIYLQVEKALEITKRMGMPAQSSLERTKSEGKRFELRKLWRLTLEMLGRNYELDEIEIIERIPEHFPFLICQSEEFQEILYLLAQNAVQAMRKQECREKKLILRAELGFSMKDDAFVKITLADTGPGVPESCLRHLFQPFYTTKTHEEGNGLGLYLARELVLRNNGTISVSSYEGCGTAFSIQLPISSSDIPTTESTKI